VSRGWQELHIFDNGFVLIDSRTSSDTLGGAVVKQMPMPINPV
jgi:hypothetical protein